MSTTQNGTAPAVLITGASSGIGAACTLHLDQLGWQVFASVRTRQDAGTLQQKASDRLTPLFLDVTDAGSIREAVETITAAAGEAGLAGLVNNAGVVVVGPLECLSASELQAQFAVNVLGLLLPYVDETMPRTGQSGLPADHVAKTVVHALTSKRPKTRYVVTRPSLSLLIRLLRLLPDRTRDRLLRQSLPKYP
jgi:NAD(P)-dependent dehydrogenase (short-subunit alcohol dehydrogenase family)